MVRSLTILLLFHLVPAAAQQATLRIEVRSKGRAVAGASVVANGAAHRTNEAGVVTVAVDAGTTQIVISKEGLAPATTSVDLRPGEERTVAIDLEPQEPIEEHVTVSATRTAKRVEEEPVRVEVLGREEIEEKLMMTPGDIVMLLNEMGGLRVQATSPSLGAASVRVQGMRGRYTRFLSDGLPLYGEQTGSFGLLQIPPMDLGQVEVIKGVASSLYGAGAMGGVVNLVSRRPGRTVEREAVVNRSTRGATDGIGWLSAPLSDRWGMTLLGGAHGQSRIDVDNDRWADLPKYARGVVRPRLFWDDGAGRTFFATGGTTWENRTGGTLPGGALQATGAPYVEALNTRRVDGGAVFQTLAGAQTVLGFRGSLMYQRQDHRFGETRERDRQTVGFAEMTARRAVARHTIVAGAAVEYDRYQPIDVPAFGYTFTVPGIFAADDVDVLPWLSVAASGRLDRHSQYGTFVSPRVSALVRHGGWVSRASYGTGFFATTARTEETEAAGLSRLVLTRPLEAERSRSASVDVTRTDGPLTYSLTVFVTRIRNPIEVDRKGAFRMVNLLLPLRNRGVEALAAWRGRDLSATATYAYVHAVETVDGATVDQPLTPRHAAGVVAMWERASKGRIGVEWYYTGSQRLEANPFRRRSEPYALFGLLAERRIGRARLFVNAENIGDVRQTRWDQLVRPAQSADGRWTVDAWAPLDGRTINGGVRVMF
jgi:outer membrane receptor for ferrienterochelin and colicins